MKLVYYFVIVGILAEVGHSDVIGIDLGNEYMKMSMIKPSRAFEIIENISGKRKTYSTVMIADERLYSTDAYNKQEYPLKEGEEIFIYLINLIGLDPDSLIFKESVKQAGLTYNFTRNTRSMATVHIDQDNYELEEIVSMILRHVKFLAKRQATIEINDIVITIPPFLDIKQRMALLDAAYLANLNVLGFVHSNTAAAIWRSVDLSHLNNSDVETIMYINIGSMSTLVSITKHFGAKKGSTNKTIEAIKVLAETWDKTLGGKHFTLAAAEVIINKYNAQLRNRNIDFDIRQNPLAMRRILLKAEKAKIVLSANKDTKVFYEALYEGINLNCIITRAEFLEQAKPLLERIEKPILEALSAVNMTREDLTEIQIVGGGVRIPEIQKIMKEILNHDLGVRLNSDEAMSFGSAFLAANISRSFKVRDVQLMHGSQYPIHLKMSPLNDENKPICTEDITTYCVEELQKETVIIKKGERYGLKKTIGFKYGGDIRIVLWTEAENGDNLDIVTYEISGLENDIKENPKYKDLLPANNSILIEFSHLGIIDITSARASIMETVLELSNTTINREEKNITKGETEVEGETMEKDTTNPPIPKYVKKDVFHNITLTVKRIYTERAPMNSSDRVKSLTKLNKMDKTEEDNRNLIMEKNKFESAIYESREFINNDRHKPYIKEEEIQPFLDYLDDAEFWLYEEGANENFTTYHLKYINLTSKVNKYVARIKGHFEAPKLIKEARKFIRESIKKLDMLLKKHEWLTKEDISTSRDRISEMGIWLDNLERNQTALAKTDEPVVESMYINIKQRAIEGLIRKVKNIPKPKPEKKEVKEGEGENMGTDKDKSKYEEERTNYHTDL